MNAGAGMVYETLHPPGRRSRPGAAAGSEPSADGAFLGREEEAFLVRRAQTGDRSALKRLIEANTRLVYSVARRYRCRSHSLDDLVQEGILGLIFAVERFDERRGCRLSTYALHWIRQAIARAAEQNDRLIHLPAQAAAELRRLRRLREEHQRDLGREPSEEELARASGVEEERVKQLLGSSQDPLSLESLIGPDQDSSLMEMAADPNAVDPEQGALLEAYREHLRCLLLNLKPRERSVLEARYGLAGDPARTLDDLSRQLRITREGVRQIEARAIRKLRHALRQGQWE
jgi:RNA polymerase primary sigma factor